MLSVLISVYNGDSSEYFQIALESIFSQSMRAEQIVLIVDGPINDGLTKVIEKYSSSLDIYALSENMGLGAVLDIGLGYCRNNLVIRCDADDYNEPNRFQKLYEASLTCNHNTAAIGSWVSEYNREEDRIISTRKFKKVCTKYGFFMRDPLAHPSVLLIKNRVLKVGGYKQLMYFEDTYLWLRLFKKKYEIVNIQEVLVQMTVDPKFYSRRSGLRYIKYEYEAFKVFFNEGLINTCSFIFNISMRVPVRLIGGRVVNSIYNIFLR